jgi:hypothetical protein
VGDTNAIDRFVSRGAVLDNWGTVLRPDRRPEGLKLSDVDVTVERDQATVTVLETVANGATLLATQSFEKVDETGFSRATTPSRTARIPSRRSR